MLQRKKVMRREQGTKTARLASVERAAAVASVRPIRFEFRDEQAQAVSLIGSFSGWRTEGMVRVQPGRWLRVLFLPPGRCEYLFVVDGRCVADPNAAETVPNVYGCANSVLTVPACAPAKACARRRFASARRTRLKLNQRRGCTINAPLRHISTRRALV